MCLFLSTGVTEVCSDAQVLIVRSGCSRGHRLLSKHKGASLSVALARLKGGGANQDGDARRHRGAGLSAASIVPAPSSGATELPATVLGAGLEAQQVSPF